MSDLPGPGRGLDKFYSRAGKILELCIYRFAHTCGFGPHAVYERFYALIRDNIVYTRYGIITLRPSDTSKRPKAAIVWDTLLEYAQ